MAEPHRPRPDGSASAGPLPVEEVEARAARLGITLDRVLEEYARIAFANLGEIVEWDAEGIMKVRDPEKLGQSPRSCNPPAAATPIGSSFTTSGPRSTRW